MSLNNSGMNQLPDEECPKCNQVMVNRLFEGPATAAKRYEDCHRICPPCQLGISNSRDKLIRDNRERMSKSKGPKIIYSDFQLNVPESVRTGIGEVLSESLNIQNRDSKRRIFCIETSEDAFTWTIIRYIQDNKALAKVIARVLKRPGPFSSEPEVLLWGVPVPSTTTTVELRKALTVTCSGLGEVPSSLSEPDVIFDFGDEGLVFIEVKVKSSNAIEYGPKFDKYLNDKAFENPQRARDSGAYQLVRNWRIGRDMAAFSNPGRPFHLINLGPEDLSETDQFKEFEASLPTSERHRFTHVSWREFLSDLEGKDGWFDQYVVEKALW